MCVVFLVPVLVGRAFARRIRLDHANRMAVFAMLGGAVLWFLAGWFARQHADTDGWGWQVAEVFAHRGKWYAFALLGLFGWSMVVWGGSANPPVGRFVVSGLFLFIVVITVWRTIPVWLWIPGDLHRDDRGAIRQRSATTCGPVALANLYEMKTGRVAPSERALTRKAGTTVEGTTTMGMIRAARQLGIHFEEPRNLTREELDQLGGPAILSISTLPTVRHATLLLAIEGDRVLTLDPDYGHYPARREWLERVRYGKVLVPAGTSNPTGTTREAGTR